MNVKWLDRSLVHLHGYYTLCTTEKQFHTELRGLKVPKASWPVFILHAWSHATVHAFEKADGKECFIVCMRPATDRDQIEVAGLLLHEAVHIWQAFCKNIGEAVPSDEFEAYSIQRIAQELMYEYRRQVYAS